MITSSQTGTMTITANQMNNLVLDFLVVNGYRDVAASFVQEAGLDPVDLEDIGNRKLVSQLLVSGNVEKAIEQINEIDSFFLDSNTEIYFLLLELHMVELVRIALNTIDDDPSSAGPVLEFAEKRIMPFIDKQSTKDRSNHLKRIEKVLSLICFPLTSLSPSVRRILSTDYRSTVASNVNKALLESRGAEGNGKLTRVIKTYVWATNELRSKS